MSGHITKEEFYGSYEKVQISNLAQLAKTALNEYSLQDAEISLLAYRENMTFAIDAGRRGRFALRIHQAGYRTDSQVQSELDYMEHLNKSGILTPDLVRTDSDSSFTLSSHPMVPEQRQCDLFHWIDGTPLRKLYEPPKQSVKDLASAYEIVGELAANIYNASESWDRPAGFDRLAWDSEGMFGSSAHLGDFRNVSSATDRQRGLLNDLAARLHVELDAFGQAPDRYGLSQADLLPENLMVCPDGIRIIDFDDAGESWIMLDVATAFCDLAETDYMQPCFESFVRGFRGLRPLPEEQLAMFSTFLMARLLSYLGHTASRDYLAQSMGSQQLLLEILEDTIPAYLHS